MTLGKMKLKHFIAPAIAFVVAGIAIGSHRVTLKALATESSALRELIADARKHESPVENPAPRLGVNKPTAYEGPLDWKSIADDIRVIVSTGEDGEEKRMHLNERLQAMDAAELVAALDQIAALDLDEKLRMILEGMIARPLGMKDPELALSRFKGTLYNDSGPAFGLYVAIEKWAEKDLAAATAWFDREVSAGTFVPKSLADINKPKLAFESEIILKMLGSDPAAAAARLADMTPAERMYVLDSRGNGRTKLVEGDQAAYADLVRSQLDEQGSLLRLGGVIRYLDMSSGFENVDAYLDRISASPEERRRCAEEAAKSFIYHGASSGKLTTNTIDALRQWAVKGAPGAVDQLTGQSIARYLNEQSWPNYSEASELVLKYRDSTGNDDVLISFLENFYTSRNRAEASELAAKVSDPKKRAALLEKFK